jgi:hypothetical protein
MLKPSWHMLLNQKDYDEGLKRYLTDGYQRKWRPWRK